MLEKNIRPTQLPDKHRAFYSTIQYIDFKSSLELSGKNHQPTLRSIYLFMLIEDCKMNATSNLVCIKPSSN